MNSFDAERTAAHIEAHSCGFWPAPEQAEAERRYLKSELDHLGLTVWQIRREAKAFGEEHPSLSQVELVALVQALWSRPVHERRLAAAMLCRIRRRDARRDGVLHPQGDRLGPPERWEIGVPHEVFEWFAPRTARMSGVTIREAVKYLDPDQRDEVLNAYREKRTARSL